MCDLWDQKVFFKISSIRTKDLFINNKLVPIVTSGESFKYHLLLEEMDNEAHKAKLQSSLSKMFMRIDALPILPKNKMLLY